MSNTLFVRFYATDHRCWDDGVGYVIAAESVDIIDKYVEHYVWKLHPYETYEMDLDSPKLSFYGKLHEGTKTDD